MRILFAMNQRERSFFLPNLNDADLPDTECLEFDTDTCGLKQWQECLSSWNPSVLVSCWSTPQVPNQHISSQNCALEYICHVTGSVRQVAPREFIEQGGIVSNWGDLAGLQVAEHGLLLALATLRGAYDWRKYIQSVNGSLRYQAAELSTQTIVGRRIGIHGFGRIARALIQLLDPFQVHISVFSDDVPENFIREHGAHPCDTLQELFQSCEILFECESLTEKSKYSVTAKELSELPDDAVFVNIGRGALVDESALLAESGRLRIALDVFGKEPVSASDAFFDAPKTILSPHIGGPTFDQYKKCGDLAVENLRAYLSNRRLQACLSLSDYDRAT